jgi:hypothetical protein
MITYIKSFFFTCLLFSCVLNIAICQDVDFLKYKVAAVPNYLVARMDSFIIAKTGKTIFEKYFVYDTIYSGYFLGDSTYTRQRGDSIYYYMGYPHYYFVFNFRFPEKPWHKLLFGWPTDTLGNFDNDHLPYVIPDRSSNSPYIFLIDSSQAISIAQSVGLKECINRPKAILKIYQEHFVWVVNCQTVKSKKEDIFFDILIDIHTGNIVHKDTTKIGYFTL